ncbi:unnamed protein product [Peronospora farinosa]|uniref:Uncharacterized protein n=1 Tax=Peronospora farinosa TaxID=134698 RepID=A0AAV0TB62_9STRA|nr:unnamed protein product [Peronospora farinosa]
MVLTSRTASSSWRGICNKSVLDQIVISMTMKYKLKHKLRKLVDGLVIRVKGDQKEAATTRAVNGDRDAAVEATNVKEAGQEIILHDLQYVLGRQPSINIATK